MMLLWRTFFLLAGLRHVSGQSLPTESSSCNPETESLLQILIDDLGVYDTIEWMLKVNDNLVDGTTLVVSSSAISGSQPNEVYTSRSYDFPGEIPAEESACIPKDKCMTLLILKSVNIKDTDAGDNSNQQHIQLPWFKVQLDGQEIASGASYTYPGGESNSARLVWATELGDSCLPKCSPGKEGVLELDIFTGTAQWIEWRIQNESSSGDNSSSRADIVVACNNDQTASVSNNDKYCTWEEWELHHIRRCLPLDECYRFILGGDTMFEKMKHRNHIGDPYTTIRFDGTPIANLTGLRFDTVEFGNSCSVSSRCQQDESRFELFLVHQVYDDPASYMSWSLSYTANQSLNNEDFEGRNIFKGGAGKGEAPMHYVTHCVKRNACMQLALSVPDVGATSDSCPYRVRITDPQRGKDTSLSAITNMITVDEDYITVDEDYIFHGAGMVENNNFNGNLAIGRCQTSAVCNAVNESLFNYQLEVGSSSTEQQLFDIAWAIYDKTDHPFQPSEFPLESYFEESLIQHYECLPKDAYLHFQVPLEDIEAAAAKYSLILDGKSLFSRGRLNGARERVHVMPLSDNDCPSVDEDLSRGAIVGIVIFSSVAFCSLPLLFVGRICWLRQRNLLELHGDDNDDETKTSDEEDDDDGGGENTEP